MNDEMATFSVSKVRVQNVKEHLLKKAGDRTAISSEPKATFTLSCSCAFRREQYLAFFYSWRPFSECGLSPS